MAALQRSKGLNRPCVLLIVIAGMERFAYKGVASNLVTYLTDVVKMSNSSAAKMVNTWSGFTSIMPLLIATLADTYLDHYVTILFFSFLYVLGLLALTSIPVVGAWIPQYRTSSSASLYWSLCMISLGQGGYNPSLQAFGADQLENEEDIDLPTTSIKTTNRNDSSNNKSMFFHWWYFGICTGSLLGVSLMSYIQDTIGWGLGFAIPTIVMVTSVAFFGFGTRFYAYKEPKDVDYLKPFENLIQAIKRTASILTYGCFSSNKETEVVELELEEKPLCKKKLDEKSEDENPKTSLYLLENVRVVVRLLPIWAMLLTFAVIFQQPATFFTKQGVTMKRNIGHSFKIPPAALQSAITVSIILLMPLYDRVFIPFTKMIIRNDKGISVMQRMGIGMCLSIIAMVIAALVEKKRLNIIAEIPIFESHSKDSIVPLSIFWLLPQYILLGISDIFTVVGMQEFFYSEVPVRMRTMGIALYTSVFGVGSFFSALLITLVDYFTSAEDGNHGWFSDDMREARLDNYYWLLALLSTLSLMLYMVFCKFYTCRDSLDNDKL